MFGSFASRGLRNFTPWSLRATSFAKTSPSILAANNVLLAAARPIANLFALLFSIAIRGELVFAIRSKSVETPAVAVGVRPTGVGKPLSVHIISSGVSD